MNGLNITRLQNKAYELFESFLTDWKQHTVFNGHESMNKIVKQGVPQGSVFGPLLFLIYVNDISCLNVVGIVTLYANDAVLYCA